MSSPTNTKKRFNEVLGNYRNWESENVIQHVKKPLLLRNNLKQIKKYIITVSIALVSHVYICTAMSIIHLFTSYLFVLFLLPQTYAHLLFSKPLPQR